MKKPWKLWKGSKINWMVSLKPERNLARTIRKTQSTYRYLWQAKCSFWSKKLQPLTTCLKCIKDGLHGTRLKTILLISRWTVCHHHPLHPSFFLETKKRDFCFLTLQYWQKNNLFFSIKQKIYKDKCKRFVTLIKF